MKISPTKAQLKDVKNVVVLQGTSVPVSVALPVEEKPAPKPVILAGQKSAASFKVDVEGFVPVEITGKDLKSVKRAVIMDGTKEIKLASGLSEDGTILTVLLPPTLVSQSVSSGKSITLVLVGPNDETRQEVAVLITKKIKITPKNKDSQK